MRGSDLQQYLHDHIPLSSAMGVRVSESDSDHVVLTAPLAPNINHRETVFGGSASALAILAAWSLVRVRLDALDAPPRIVIQRNSVEYDKPLIGEFAARSYLLEPDRWSVFLRSLERRGRARVRVGASLESEGATAGTFEGEFVAIDVPRQVARHAT